MNDIGHNLPPDMTITVGEVANDLSGWMAEHPVITNEDEAREAKVFVDRASLAIKDLEDERTQKVRPLNEEVKKINDQYRSPRESLDRVLGILKDRLGGFLAKEEERRIAIAQEAARIAAQAEQAARTAEQKEQDIIEAAHHGELGLDIAATTAEADAAFAAYQKAERQAAIAERETRVKIGGGFSRALGLKNKEELVIVDSDAAFKAIGLNDYIEEALLKSARAYRKLHNQLPAGVEARIERKA